MFRVLGPVDSTVNDNIEVKGVIDPYTLQFSRRADSPGDFSMTVELNDNNLELTKLNNIIEVNPDGKCYAFFISRTIDLDKKSIQVAGKDLRVMLEWHYTSLPAGPASMWDLGALRFSDYIKYNYSLEPGSAAYDPDYTYGESTGATCRLNHLAALVDHDCESSNLVVNNSTLHTGKKIAMTECETLDSLTSRYSEITHEYPVLTLTDRLSNGNYGITIDWITPTDEDMYIVFDKYTRDRGRTYTETNEDLIDIYSTFGEGYYYDHPLDPGSNQTTLFYQARSKRSNNNKGIFCRHRAGQQQLKVGDCINTSSDEWYYDRNGQPTMRYYEWHQLYTNVAQGVFYATVTGRTVAQNVKQSNVIQCNIAFNRGYLNSEVNGKTKGVTNKYECTITNLDSNLELYDIINIKDLEIGVTKKCMVAEVEYVLVGDHLEKIYSIEDVDWA